MELKEIRYVIEHRLLPDAFFAHSSLFIANVLMTDGKFIHQIYQEISSEEDVECLYSPDDFSIEKVPTETNIHCIVIHMPKPVTTPQCKMVCITFDDNGGSLHYITLEKDDFKDDFTNVICEWTQSGDHLLLEFAIARSTPEEIEMIRQRIDH